MKDINVKTIIVIQKNTKYVVYKYNIKWTRNTYKSDYILINLMITFLINILDGWLD